MLIAIKSSIKIKKFITFISEFYYLVADICKLIIALIGNLIKYRVFFKEDLVIVTASDKYFYEITDFLKLSFDEKYYKKIKIRNKLPRKNNDVLEGFWKRYTTNNVSREGDKDETILKRTKDLIKDTYFKKLLLLRDKYFQFKKEFGNL